MHRAHRYAAAAILAVALALARLLRPDVPATPVLALPAPGTTPAAASPASSATRPTTSSAPASASARPPAAADLRAALTALDAVRAAAYAAPLDGDPDAWATRDCACHADDVRRLRDLARDGTALRGQRITVDSLALVAPPTPEHADLVVVDRMTAYTAVDAAGRVVARWPASGPRRWRVTLVRVRDRWLLGAVARAP